MIETSSLFFRLSLYFLLSHLSVSFPRLLTLIFLGYFSARVPIRHYFLLLILSSSVLKLSLLQSVCLLSFATPSVAAEILPNCLRYIGNSQLQPFIVFLARAAILHSTSLSASATGLSSLQSRQSNHNSRNTTPVFSFSQQLHRQQGKAVSYSQSSQSLRSFSTSPVNAVIRALENAVHRLAEVEEKYNTDGSVLINWWMRVLGLLLSCTGDLFSDPRLERACESLFSVIYDRVVQVIGDREVIFVALRDSLMRLIDGERNDEISPEMAKMLKRELSSIQLFRWQISFKIISHMLQMNETSRELEMELLSVASSLIVCAPWVNRLFPMPKLQSRMVSSEAIGGKEEIKEVDHMKEGEIGIAQTVVLQTALDALAKFCLVRSSTARKAVFVVRNEGTDMGSDDKSSSKKHSKKQFHVLSFEEIQTVLVSAVVCGHSALQKSALQSAEMMLYHLQSSNYLPASTYASMMQRRDDHSVFLTELSKASRSLASQVLNAALQQLQKTKTLYRSVSIIVAGELNSSNSFQKHTLGNQQKF